LVKDTKAIYILPNYIFEVKIIYQILDVC